MKTSIVRMLLPVLLVLVLLGSAAFADTLFLKNGKKFEGSLVSDSGGVIKFKTAGGVLTFKKSEVSRVEKGATAADEYKVRLKDLEEDDIEGRLALARWCREKKLFGQRKRLLRAILKTCPDHPGARKESGQAWRGGKWVKAKNVKPLPVKPGKALAIKETSGKVAVPAGWERKDAAKTVTASGPNNYASAPVLTVEVIGELDPAKEFPEQNGWTKPEAIAAGGLNGLTSRRDYVENLIGRVEWRTVLPGKGFSVRFRLRCLECDSEDYGAALGVATASLEFAAPPADYVNKHYRYQLNLPKPRKGWEGGEDDEHDLIMSRVTSDAIDFAFLMVVTGNPGKEYDQVKKMIERRIASIKADGDIEKDEEITVAGEKARYVQGTHLEDGIPIRSICIQIEHQKRIFYILFKSHEFGREKDGHSLKTVIDSFRFIK